MVSAASVAWTRTRVRSRVAAVGRRALAIPSPSSAARRPPPILPAARLQRGHGPADGLVLVQLPSSLPRGTPAVQGGVEDLKGDELDPLEGVALAEIRVFSPPHLGHVLRPERRSLSVTPAQAT